MGGGKAVGELCRMRGSGYLVNSDTVDVGIVHKPYDLIGEQLPIVLRREVRFSGLTGVELQGLADPLPQHIQCWVGLHDLGHGLLHQRLHARDPVAKHAERQRKCITMALSTEHPPRQGSSEHTRKGTEEVPPLGETLPVKVISQVHCYHYASG